MRAAYRLVRKPSGPGGTNQSFSLGVPIEIALLAVEAGVTTFRPELVEEGILYRPVKMPVAPPPAPLPAWLNGRAR